MAYTVLARRYRSNTFDEVVGQDHVAQTLKKAIASGRIAHAYLFNGTRGVGKTSMARILAKALNCEKFPAPTTEPCGQCNSCKAIARGEDIDVVEIDAASNTQVDKTREVILDNAQYRPARSRFKIYIIDEVHMLSKASFNALLKTLEEPPEHVKFILATTEPEKVLSTIHSRCQRYDFRNIPTREIAEHLKHICVDEKITADEDALMLVAKAGSGSMRDSLSLLDRLLSIGEKRLTIDTIEQLLGLPKAQLVMDLAQGIGEGRVKDVLTLADRMICDGLSPDALIVSLVDHLRNLLIIRTCGADSTLVEVAALSMDELGKQAQRFDPIVLTEDITILEDLRRQLRVSQAGRALLDATLVRMAMAEQFTSIADLLARVDGGAPVGNVAGQKKKFDAPVVATAAVARPAAPVAPVPPPPPSNVVPVSTPIIAPVSPIAAPMPSAPMADAPAASESISVADDSDGDDDLPRPGKVWEGPSLAEMARQQVGARSAPAPAKPIESNVVGIDPSGLAGIWKNLLKTLQDRPGLHALVCGGELRGIEDGQAVICYPDETFPKMLGRGGKREMVSEALSQVLGQAVGVRFEVDEQRPPEPAASMAGSTATAPQALKRPDRPESERPAYTPPPLVIRPTPEQLRDFEQDPLIRGLMTDFNATIVKITEE